MAKKKYAKLADLQENGRLAKEWTKTQIQNATEKVKGDLEQKITTVYRPKGSVDTYDALPKENNVAGDVYDVKAEFELDGKTYPAGTNVAYTTEGKWDPLGGMKIDLTGYMKESDIEDIEQSELEAIWNED